MIKVALEIAHVLKYMGAVMEQQTDFFGTVVRNHPVVIDHVPASLARGTKAGLQPESGREVTSVSGPAGLAAVKHALVVSHDSAVPEGW